MWGKKRLLIGENWKIGGVWNRAHHGARNRAHHGAWNRAHHGARNRAHHGAPVQSD